MARNMSFSFVCAILISLVATTVKAREVDCDALYKSYQEKGWGENFIANCYSQGFFRYCKDFCEMHEGDKTCRWGNYMNSEVYCGKITDKEELCEACDTNFVYQKNCCQTCIDTC